MWELSSLIGMVTICKGGVALFVSRVFHVNIQHEKQTTVDAKQTKLHMKMEMKKKCNSVLSESMQKLFLVVLKVKVKQQTWATRQHHLEYGASACATAAKTHTNKLDQVENMGLRTILGAMKSTPTLKWSPLTLEGTVSFSHTEKRWNECQTIHCTNASKTWPRIRWK